MACHGAEGQGVDGVGPRLAGSEWVQGNPKALTRIVLQGFAGGALERNENIAGVMPGHSYMADEEIASILTFIRQSWGHKASPVEAETIQKIREETKQRSDTWSPNELRQIVNSKSEKSK
jgi:mono/diheme cytochrome c family protein